MQRDRFYTAEELHTVVGAHHACANQLTNLQLAARRPLTHLVRVTIADVAHGEALAGVHRLHFEYRSVGQQPLLGQHPLVVGQQRPAHLKKLLERAAFEQHEIHHQWVGHSCVQRLGEVVRMSVSLVAHLGQQLSPIADLCMLSGLRVQPVHPLGKRQLLAAQMAFLVLAAGPAPARLVAAEIGARLGPMRLQQIHQRVIRLGACAAQQAQPALDIATIAGDAGQVDQGQRPVRIHRLGRQQFTLGLFDVANSLQRDRPQPPPRHPRSAWHLGFHHLCEQAQRRRTAAVGADSLGHQQLSQQRVDKVRPQLSCHIDRAVGRDYRGALVGPAPRHPPRPEVAPCCTARPTR